MKRILSSVMSKETGIMVIIGICLLVLFIGILKQRADLVFCCPDGSRSGGNCLLQPAAFEEWHRRYGGTESMEPYNGGTAGSRRIYPALWNYGISSDVIFVKCDERKNFPNSTCTRSWGHRIMRLQRRGKEL